jgi:probable F420-dependent oxidoreductase
VITLGVSKEKNEMETAGHQAQKKTFGIRVPNSGPLASPASIVKVAREAESQGYHSVWVHDHLTWTDEIHRTHISAGSEEALQADQKPDFYEAMTTLSYLAGIVNSVRLGIACLVVPTRNPIYAAKQVANLDVLTAGKLDFGVGIGGPSTIISREYEVLGVQKSLRGKIADDYIKAMKSIWTTNPSSYNGRFISFKDAEVMPKPCQKPHPPIWIGGWTEPAMKRTALLGDIWLPAWLTPKDIGTRYEMLKEMARQFGRPPGAVQLGFEVYACIDENSQKAKRDAIGTLRASRSTYEREMTLEELEDVSLVGSPEEVSEKVKAYIMSGVLHFEIKFIYRTIDHLLEMMKLFSRAVLPNFT